METELIKIIEKDNIRTVSARDLHEKLEVKTSFAHWITRMIDYGFEENADFTVVKNGNGENGQFGSIEYYISLDMAKEICMIQRSEMGRRFRQYFIECEKALRDGGKQISVTKDSPLEVAKFLREVAADYSDTPTYRQILDAYAVKQVTGQFLLPLPDSTQEEYTATEVGDMLGISKNKVGKLANKIGIKNEQYGRWCVDKSPYSDKEVRAFRYYKNAVDELRKSL